MNNLTSLKKKGIILWKNKITIEKDEVMRKFFTSESVTEGHPDKVCDNISDGILDAILTVDPAARAAIECAAAFDTLLIMGEVTTTANVNYEEKAREIIKER